MHIKLSLSALLMILACASAQDCYKKKSAKTCRSLDGCSWIEKKCRKPAVTPQPTQQTVPPTKSDAEKCAKFSKARLCKKQKKLCSWVKNACKPLSATKAPGTKAPATQAPANNNDSKCAKKRNKVQCTKDKKLNCAWNKKEKKCLDKPKPGANSPEGGSPIKGSPLTLPSKLVCSGKSKNGCSGTKGCHWESNSCKNQVDCWNWPYCIGYHFNRASQKVEKVPQGKGLSCQKHDMCLVSTCPEDDPNWPCWTKGCLPHSENGEPNTCEEQNDTGGNGPRHSRFFEILATNVNCDGCESTTANGFKPSHVLMTTLETCANICQQLAPAGRPYKSCGRIMYPHFDHTVPSEWEKKRECRLLTFGYQNSGSYSYNSGGKWDVLGMANPPAHAMGRWNSDDESFVYSQDLLDAAMDKTKTWYGWFKNEVVEKQAACAKFHRGDKAPITDLLGSLDGKDGSLSCITHEIVYQTALSTFSANMHRMARICKFFIGKDQNKAGNKYTCAKLHKDYGCQMAKEAFPKDNANSFINAKDTGGLKETEICGSLGEMNNRWTNLGAPKDMEIWMWPVGWGIPTTPKRRKCDANPLECYKDGGRYPCKYDCDPGNCATYNSKNKCPKNKCKWNASFKLSNGKMYGRCEGTHVTKYV